jgi:hypothetical protein
VQCHIPGDSNLHSHQQGNHKPCIRCYCIGRFPELNVGCHILQKRSLWNIHVIPSFFLPFKSTVEVISFNAVEHCLLFPLDVRQCFKMSFQFHFQFGKQSEIAGG